MGRHGCRSRLFYLGKHADDDRVTSSPGNNLMYRAQGDRLSRAGCYLVSEGSAQEVLICAREDESLLLSSEIHHGLDLRLTGAGVDGLELNPIHGGGNDGGL